jgi:uncharacterized UBP type Zn finger protein
MAINEEHVSQLTSMGFPASQAQEALTITNGNLEHAVNYLLGAGVVVGDPDSKQPASNNDSSSNDSVAAKAGAFCEPPSLNTAWKMDDLHVRALL